MTILVFVLLFVVCVLAVLMTCHEPFLLVMTCLCVFTPAGLLAYEVFWPTNVPPSIQAHLVKAAGNTPSVKAEALRWIKDHPVASSYKVEQEEEALEALRDEAFVKAAGQR